MNSYPREHSGVYCGLCAELMEDCECQATQTSASDTSEIDALRAENERLKDGAKADANTLDIAEKAIAVWRERAEKAERERDEWKQYAATGVALRRQELAQHMDALGQLTAAIAERDSARAWSRRWKAVAKLHHTSISMSECRLINERDSARKQCGKLEKALEHLGTEPIGTLESAKYARTALAEYRKSKGE